MAGFALIFDPNSTPQSRENDFQSLLELSTKFKQLELPEEIAIGRYCTAAKLDAPSSLHHGIAHDEQSGSWLMAAGTIVALEGNTYPYDLLDGLLLDYLDNGPNALDRYDGNFAIAIYNGWEDSLSVVSDPFGFFAIYYARCGQQVFISSSALAIACQVNSKPDDLTIECILMTGKPYGEKTLWQDVKRVRPATVIKIIPGKFQEFEYWTPQIDKNITRCSMKEALELADEKICRNFKRALFHESKVWADLTGGYDTRLTTLYLEKTGIPFIAYCVGPDGHPDVEVSRLVSKEMGWEYYHMPYPASWADEQSSWFDAALGKGDGLLEISQLSGVIRGSQERSLTSFVSIPGVGVDEWRYHIFGANTLIFDAIPRVNYDNILDAKVMEDIPISAMRQNRTTEVRNAIKAHLSGSVAKYLESPKITQIDIAFLRYRHPVHAGAYLSAQAGIMRPLNIFCFKELENFGLSINHQWRIKYDSRFVRNLFEKGNPRLANLPTENGDPIIPIRLTTMHRFGPLWLFLADHTLGKVSKKMLGRQLSLHAPHRYPYYPLPTWREAWLRWAAAEHLLTPEKMLSGALYNAPVLGEVVAQGLAGQHKTGEFLDRVITVEMALRAAGTSIA